MRSCCAVVCAVFSMCSSIDSAGGVQDRARRSEPGSEEDVECSTFLVTSSSPAAVLHPFYVHQLREGRDRGWTGSSEWMTVAPPVPLSSSSCAPRPSSVPEGVNCVTQREDGRLVASAGWDHRVRIFRSTLHPITTSTHDNTTTLLIEREAADGSSSSSSSSSSVVPCCLTVDRMSSPSLVLHRLTGLGWSSFTLSAGGGGGCGVVCAAVSRYFASLPPPLVLSVLLPFHTAAVQSIAFAPATQPRPKVEPEPASRAAPPSALAPVTRSALTSFSRLSTLPSSPSVSLISSSAWSSRPASSLLRSSTSASIGSAAGGEGGYDMALLASGGEDQRIACWAVAIDQSE
jgi:hypothetical protein